MNRISKQILSLGVVLTLLVGLLAGTAQAADYQGSGTAADPYLVTTPEQLSDIRKNLSAHYQLAATVDLSSVENFKPIGTMAKPFTGSFTCPVNADGQPMYAILNLSIHTAEGVYIDEGKSQWEAALFSGVTNGSLSNILILNANIKNDNFGDNRGAVVYGDYKPGMDEMPTAPLVGYAINATITNCGATGVVDAHSNGCAGLISSVNGGSVTNCWSTVNVKTLGKWNTGSLIGSAGNAATVTNCWATGNAENTQSNAGALFGGVDGIIVQNCYATGDAKNGLLGRAVNTTVSNCYYTGNAIEEYSDSVNNTVTNCYVLEGKIVINGFTSASAEQICQAFKRVKGWDITGTLPVLTAAKAPADLSAYKVGVAVGGGQEPTQAPTAAPTEAPTTAPTQGTTAPTQGTTAPTQGTTAPTQGTTAPTQGTAEPTSGTTAPTSGTTAPTQGTTAPTSGTTAPTQGTAAPTQGTESTAEPSAGVTAGPTEMPTQAPTEEATEPAQDSVISLEELTSILEALPDAENITLEYKDAVMQAVKAAPVYFEQGELSALQYKQAVDANKAIQALMVGDLGNRLMELPEAEGLNASHRAEVEAVLADYDYLSEDYRTFIAEELRTKLEQLRSALDGLEAEQPSEEPADEASAFTAGEITVLVILAVTICLNAAANVVITVFLYKKKKNDIL